MKRKLMITIDVEAQKFRAPNDHVNRLIWGRADGQELGIGTMMSIADNYGVQLTFFHDYAERDFFGDDILDVAREIRRRGHDLQLHLHEMFFSKNFLEKHGISAQFDLMRSPKDHCRHYVDYLMESHAKVSPENPIAHRSGGFWLGLPFLEVMSENGIKFDSSYIVGIPDKSPITLGEQTFFWWNTENRICEIPVTCSPCFGQDHFIYNFNSKILYGKPVAFNRELLDAFYGRYGNEAIAVMLLHSRSFYSLDAAGHYIIPQPRWAQLFEAFIADCVTDMDIISMKQLAHLLDSEPSDPTVEAINKAEAIDITPSCPICGTLAAQFKAYNGKFPRECPKCRSLERQRVFFQFSQRGTFPPALFNGRRMLHVAASTTEKEFFKNHFNLKETVTVDIRPEAGTDLVADISNMPEVPSESYDIVFLSYVLANVESLDNAIKELARVLKPGGQIFCYDMLAAGMNTTFFTDHKKVTAWYGQDAYEKYHVGSFRKFGQNDYTTFFAPYFDCRLHEAIDTPTLTRQFWLHGTKKSGIESLLEGTPCPSPQEQGKDSGGSSIFAGIKNWLTNRRGASRLEVVGSGTANKKIFLTPTDRRLIITVAVEAFPHRTVKGNDPVQQLIYGKFDGKQYGVPMMLDIAERFNVPMTFFLDYAEENLHGQAITDVGKMIVDRGRDLQLHTHIDFLPEDMFGGKENRKVEMLTAPQAKLVVEQAVNAHAKTGAQMPIAFRGGSYQFNGNLLTALRQAGILFDSSYNADRAQKQGAFHIGAKGPFKWANGLIEIPIPNLSGFANDGAVVEYNFNNYYLLRRSVEECIAAHKAFLDTFYSTYGNHAVAVLVMHSWSFLHLDSKSGRFSKPIPANAEKFSKILETISEHAQFTSFAALSTADVIYDPEQIAYFDPEQADSIELSPNDSSQSAPGSPLIPYEKIRAPKGGSSDEILQHGWTYGNYGRFEFSETIPWHLDVWQSGGFTNESHAWNMLEALLRDYSDTGDLKYLKPAVKVALSWVNHHIKPGAAISSQAWGDLATAMRAYRLAFILEAAEREKLLTVEEVDVFKQMLDRHRVFLIDDKNFSAGTNHGFFLVIGQLAMSRRFMDSQPLMKDAFEQGQKRLAMILDTHFTTEGVHKEHSPMYHYMLLSSIKGLLQGGLVHSEETKQLCQKVEEVFSWFMFPDSTMAPFGDSSCSKGVSKRPPAIMRLFSQGGYFVLRKPSPQAPDQLQNDSYLAQLACFHSRVHKHADDLSFVWYDRGAKIFVDAGKLNYEHKTPERAYCASTRAHNTLEFDGLDYDRLATQTNVRAKPYGSALKGFAETSYGVAAVESQVTHWDSIRHGRVLIYLPARWLIVCDWFDATAASHSVKQWFHLDAELSLTASETGPGLKVLIASSPQPLRIAPLLDDTRLSRLYKGEHDEDGRLQGWYSPQDNVLSPNYAFNCYWPDRRSSGAMATLCSFSEELQLGASEVSSFGDGLKGKFLWTDESGAHALGLERAANGSLKIEYEGPETPSAEIDENHYAAI